MISYDDFAKLRLNQFLPADEIDELWDWEYLDQYWVGEGSGFTECLQLEDEPLVTRVFTLAFDDLDSEVVQKILATLGVPLLPGMGLSEIREALKEEPFHVYQFADDRKSYEFKAGGYQFSCTVLNEGGLIYLVVMRTDA